MRHMTRTSTARDEEYVRVKTVNGPKYARTSNLIRLINSFRVSSFKNTHSAQHCENVVSA